jgi:hypothetical protein
MSLTNIISVGSLIFVGITMLINALQSYELRIQTKLLAEATRATNSINTANVSLNINSTMHDLSRLLIKRPKLYPYIYGGLPVPEEEPLRTRVLAAAEMFMDFMSMTLDQAPLLPEETGQVWRRYFGDLVEGSIVLQHYWRENRNWYETPVRNLLDPVVFPDGVPDKLEAEPATGGGGLTVAALDEVALQAGDLNLASPEAAELYGTVSLSQEQNSVLGEREPAESASDEPALDE